MFGKILKKVGGVFNLGDQRNSSPEIPNNRPVLFKESSQELQQQPVPAAAPNQVNQPPEKPNNDEDEEKKQPEKDDVEPIDKFVNQLKRGVSTFTDKLRVFPETVIKEVQGGVKKLTSKGEQLKGEIVVKVEEFRDDIKSSLDKHIGSKIREKKYIINGWIKRKTQILYIKLIKRGKPILKKSLKKPGMWPCVVTMVDDLVDELWPDIEEEALFRLRVAFDKPYVEIPPSRRSCCLFYPFLWFRNWILYTTHPVDKNLYQIMSTISWWLLLILSGTPIYGVQSFFYLLFFILMDKSDEYQLVEFIISFKRMQFFAAGIVSAVIGYSQYYSCNIRIEYKEVNVIEYGNCMIDESAKLVHLYIDPAAELLKIALLWAAFFLLPCSRQKGKPKFEYEELKNARVVEEEDCCCCVINSGRGGRLKSFMIYDLFTFLLSVGSFFAVYFLLHLSQEFQVKATIFAVKLIYGMLSFPFLLFMLPYLGRVLSRAQPTGYTQDGICIARIGADRFREAEQDSESKGLIENEIDIVEILNEDTD